MVPLLTTAYLPPIEYLAFFLEGEVLLERCEHFQKQSFRNRTVILTANGPQNLSIPVIHAAPKEPISQVRIDYATPWQRTHWRTIESAYGCSPYFLYYKDLLQPFYETHFDYLFDYNTALCKTILQLLPISTALRYTKDFAPLQPNDLRTTIHPRKKLEADYPFALSEFYYQVFHEKFGFIPNLSILDLLFNLGPDSVRYLQRSLQDIKPKVDQYHVFE